MNIAVIPARGGSKRIPRKNIKRFYDRPMIGFAIEAAKQSALFDKIIVSTDDKEIADIATEYGAEVPFIRPESLSDDFTGTGAVVNHAINWIATEWMLSPDYVCCIYPTAPLLLPQDLISAFDQLWKAPNKSFAFSVAHFAFPIQRSLGFDEHGQIKANFPECIPMRSQDLPDAFHDAGQFYFGRTQAFLEGVVTFSAASIPIFLPRSRVVDIDTEEDWQEAEIKYEVLKSKGIV